MIATTIQRIRAHFTRTVDTAELAAKFTIEDIRATEPWLPVRYTLVIDGRIVKYDVRSEDLFGVMATNTNVDLHTLINVRSALKTTPLGTVALGNVLVRPFELEDVL